MDEKFDLESFPTSISAQRMMSYVTSGFYDRSYVAKWMYQVMGLEYDEAERLATELPEQFFPETATWGLKYHEIKWGLPVREYLSYEERRALIYEKRDSRVSMTPYRMEQYLNNVTKFQVYVADVHDPGEFGFAPEHPNIFRVYCIGEGTLDTKSVRRVIDRAKQSHTMYILTELVRWELDHRGLEWFRVSNVNIHVGIPFWYCLLFNGSAYLDGSELLNAVRRYNLRLMIGYRGWKIRIREWVDMRSMSISAGIKMSERFRAAVGIYLGGIDFWQTRRLDGSANLDGSLTLGYYLHNIRASVTVHSKIRLTEEISAGPVIITRNLAYFDGGDMLDGSRLLNSIYRKEDL